MASCDAFGLTRRLAVLYASTFLALSAAVAPAAAQLSRFGKNKIQYDDFKWTVLSSEHVDLYYYPEERELALIALQYAEESYKYLEQKFSYNPKDRIPLVVYSSHQHFEQTNIVPFFLPEGVAGFTEWMKGRVALPFNGSYADFRRVVRHELVHVFQARKGSHLKRLHPGGNEWQSPQWFTEGLAELWSEPWGSQGDLMVRDLLLNGKVPDAQSLDRYSGSFAIYKLGQNLLGFLSDRYGEERIVELMESEWKYKGFSTAFRKVYGKTLEEVSVEWKRHLRLQYFPMLAHERPVSTTATPVVTRGRLNFTPSIVPASVRDGQPGLCYVSLTSGYTTINTADLLQSNRRLETRIRGDRSGDYESFHPLLTSIDVSRDGRLAFVAKSGPRDAMYIHDLASGERERRISWQRFVVLSSPSWSPDGRTIVFVGLTPSGYSDLYLWHPDTDELVRLTADRYLEATPRWSPTGDAIVFASDRTPFGREGARNLYILDLERDEIQPLTFGRWVDRDPDWSPEGDRIVFASDRAGTLDLYVVDRNGDGFRASAFAAGTMHPRWFRENGTEGIVFTAFEDLSYAIYRIDVPVDAPQTVALEIDPGVTEWEWEQILPEENGFREGEYARNFTLDFASAALAFAEDGGRAQGAQIFFSDMLGDNLFVATVNSQSGRTNLFEGFTGSLTYVNLKRRLNWGVSGYRLRSFFTSLLGGEFDRSGFNNEGIGIRNDFFEERWGVSGLISYPISKFQRFENRITLERNELTELPRDPGDFDDFFLRDAWLVINSVGYVFDNTLWNPTGPMDGQRLNVTVAPVWNLSSGRLESTDLLVDARKYFRTSLNTTYAVRSRTRISDGEVPTFYYLGGPMSLRGYPTFVLNGSHTFLLNQEWRFPILRPNRLRTGMASLLGFGIWGAVFMDLGNAWTLDGLYQDDDGVVRELGWWPGLLGSYGFSLRYPLIPPFILRFDWANRFAIDDKRELFPDEDDLEFSFFIGFNY